MTDPGYTTEPPPEGPPPEGPPPERTNPWIVAAGLAFLAVIIGIIVLATMDDDDDDDEDIVSDTTTEVEVTVDDDDDDTTTTVDDDDTTTTTADDDGTTTTTADDDTITSEERTTIIWPDPEGSQRFDDPVAAATSFANDLAGFTDPIIGEFIEGEQGSGEVHLRASEDGPQTKVVVHRLSDDNWWVLSADTDNIELDQPSSTDVIENPVTVSGSATSSEGNVEVVVYETGNTEPLGTGNVTGGAAGEMDDFSGEISYEDPSEDHGVLLLLTRDENGEVREVLAIPVRFTAGA